MGVANCGAIKKYSLFVVAVGILCCSERECYKLWLDHKEKRKAGKMNECYWVLLPCDTVYLKQGSLAFDFEGFYVLTIN